MTEFAAIILAGGKSSRMGRDKAAIAIDGVPLLKRTCLLASQCTSQVYVITPWIEKYQAIVPDCCQMIRETVVTDESEPHGPLIGFIQALPYIQTEWVLLLACDLPNLTATEVREWAIYLETTPQNAIALLPKSPQGWEPLCGFYRSSCLSSLKEYSDLGGRSFQKWLQQHIVRELPVSDRHLLFNCNTPDDLARLDRLTTET